MSSFINQPYIGGQEYILILHNRFHSKKSRWHRKSHS